MTASTSTSLKALFETGDTLLQDSFIDLIDSFLNITNTSAQTITSPITFSNTVNMTKALDVAQGGTGVSALTAYSVVVGGTTSTGRLQSVDVSGIPQGYVLTYTSAGAPPAWTPAGGLGVVGIANGGTGATTAVSAFDALKQNATTTVTGVSTIATTAQVVSGLSTTQIITPSGFKGNSSIVEDGYYKLPGGLIIQWGYAEAATGTTGTISYPIAFNTLYSTVITQQAVAAQYYAIVTASTNSFNYSASGTGTGIRWIAFGV